MLVGMFVGITYLVSVHDRRIAHSDAAVFCRALIYVEALLAYTCLITLQYFGPCVFAVKRTPETCFPLPEKLLHNMRASARNGERRGSVTSALKEATAGLGNLTDPAGERGVYCVRCFVWRAEDGHHCSECQRCFNDFDHHCGVLGCCVCGRGFKGNMWAFTLLITMAAVGLITAISSAALLSHPWAAEITMSRILETVGFWLGAILLCAYCAYRGFMWVFYDRHAHRRVNKRRDA